MTRRCHRGPIALLAALPVVFWAPAACAQLQLRAPLSTPISLRAFAQNAARPSENTPAAPSPPVQNPSAEDLERVHDANRYRVARYFLTPLAGWASGTALAVLAGFGATAIMCTPSNTYEMCVGSVIVGAYAGFLLGAPLGITFSGRWLHGLGGYSGAFLGTLFGVALAIPVALIARNEVVTYSIGILPAIGGMIVSELQGAARARVLAAPVVVPTASPIVREGQFTGLALGVTVRGF